MSSKQGPLLNVLIKYEGWEKKKKTNQNLKKIIGKGIKDTNVPKVKTIETHIYILNVIFKF